MEWPRLYCHWNPPWQHGHLRPTFRAKDMQKYKSLYIFPDTTNHITAAQTVGTVLSDLYKFPTMISNQQPNLVL